MNQLQERIYSNDYADLIIPYNFMTKEQFLEVNAAFSPQIVNNNYGVIHIKILPGTENLTQSFLYSLVPNLYTTLDTTSLETTGILRTQNQPALQLKGEDILIGFLDTGILYTHPAFLAPGNQTRIERIWDQTIPNPDNTGPYGYGTEYTREEINQALASNNPLLTVPTTDTNGHGTFIAGVAAGTPDPLAEFIGAAPESRLAVVRLKEAKQHLRNFYFFTGEIPVFQETDIMTAIQYLVSLSRQLALPLVICMAIGSNQGDHMGNSPLGISLQQLDILPGIVTVAAGGNESDKSHHFYGMVSSDTEPQSVELFVRENTAGFSLELWGLPPELFSVGFRSPVGEVIPRIPARMGKSETIRFILENTVIYVNYELVQNTSGNQLIFIRFQNPTPGIWGIDVYSTVALSGEFHMWLPISGFSSPDVTFLSPDPFTTITEPGNSTQVITVSAYSAYNNSLFINSSRGFTLNNQIKPDFASPGVDITGPSLRDGYLESSGTSAAAALAAGSSALLFEWGLKQTPFKLFSSFEIKNYLIRGAQRTPGQTYPNREWGYGKLNLYQVFSSVSTS